MHMDIGEGTTPLSIVGIRARVGNEHIRMCIYTVNVYVGPTRMRMYICLVTCVLRTLYAYLVLWLRMCTYVYV